MRGMMKNFRNILLWFANPTLMFFALPWLMLLLVMGTVAQRYIGLYASQKLFFGSFVLWAGMVPLPGAYSLLALVAASLIAKLLLKSPFSREQSGTILIHISMIVLLLGGLITALCREEGYVVLGQGESAQAVSDYRLRELAVLENGTLVKAVPYADLRAGTTVESGAVPFRLRVVRNCFPCGAQARTQPQENLRGVAAKIELTRAPYAKDDAKNLAGAEIAVTGAGAEDGTYIAFEGLAAPETIVLAKDRYELMLRPAQRPLPFGVRLLRFTKSDYPGTSEPRAYRSDVVVKDGTLTWNAAIEMNQPLRYKGYTLYQSSFVDDGNGKMMSVLAVVKNAGGWFPYIAITMLCVGLLVHLGIVLRGKKDAETR